MPIFLAKEVKMKSLKTQYESLKKWFCQQEPTKAPSISYLGTSSPFGITTMPVPWQFATIPKTSQPFPITRFVQEDSVVRLRRMLDENQQQKIKKGKKKESPSQPTDEL